MTRTVQVCVSAGSSSADEVNMALLAANLQKIKGLSIGDAVPTKSNLVPRFTGMELLATFATSAAAHQLAKAVRDFVTRQRVKITMGAEGQIMTIEASGGEKSSTADVVGFLTHQYAKKVSDVSRSKTTKGISASKKMAKKKTTKKGTTKQISSRP